VLGDNPPASQPVPSQGEPNAKQAAGDDVERKVNAKVDPRQPDEYRDTARRDGEP